MADLPNPVDRTEQYLNAIATGDPSGLPDPVTREEVYLDYIAQHGGGGGGGGTTNYNALSNRPQINGVTLSGNKTSANLGLQPTLQWDNEPTEDSPKAVRSGGVFTALAGKVDKEAGKVLSDNNYSSDEKTKLANIAAGAEANVITKITLNGVELVPVNKTVAINVITRAVNNLANYYLKSETYTKTEVDDLISAISTLTLDIVETLPTTDISTTTIYLVPVTGSTSVYMQYAYINNQWAQLGTTQVDLTNYYTKSQVDAALLLKQDVLTFDNAPTSASDNPVKSGGIYSALAGKQDTLTFDAAPTSGSNNPVKSGGVYTALQGKQDTLTFDSSPTAGSTNPVTSGGVKAALDNVSVDTATTERLGVVKPDGDTITIDNDGTIHGSNSIQIDETDLAFTDGLLGLQPTRRMFVGTTAEWNALNAADKALYSVVSLTDDGEALGVDAVDAIIDGDLRPVTSNAVHDALDVVDVSSLITPTAGMDVTIDKAIKCGNIVQLDIYFIYDSTMAQTILTFDDSIKPRAQIALGLCTFNSSGKPIDSIAWIYKGQKQIVIYSSSTHQSAGGRLHAVYMI